jgi:hypothetical protein
MSSYGTDSILHIVKQFFDIRFICDISDPLRVISLGKTEMSRIAKTLMISNNIPSTVYLGMGTHYLENSP